jgi:hypothetical protein
MDLLTRSFVCCLLIAAPGFASSPDPKDLEISTADQARARSLVEKLASEVFEEREEAQDELAKMGRLAMPALLEGLNANPSPEVRFRCQALIPRASHDDIQARLATFLADTEGKFEHDMPGWNEFRKLAGESSVSRATFVELLKEPANRTLVLGITGAPDELGRLIAQRKQELHQMRFPRTPNATRRVQSLPDMLALMFAESHVATKHIPRSTSTITVHNLPALTTAIRNGDEKAEVYKALVGHWIETRDEAAAMYTAMNQATSLGLTKQGTVVAAKLLQFKGATISYRFYAAFAIARNGAKDHLPALEAAFADEAALNLNRNINGKLERHQVQMRDMALVAAVLLTGQDASEYGFTEQYKNNPGMQFTYSNWRLPEENRKAAFEKWKAWREKNPDFGKPKADQ